MKVTRGSEKQRLAKSLNRHPSANKSNLAQTGGAAILCCTKTPKNPAVLPPPSKHTLIASISMKRPGSRQGPTPGDTRVGEESPASFSAPLQQGKRPALWEKLGKRPHSLAPLPGIGAGMLQHEHAAGSPTGTQQRFRVSDEAPESHTAPRSSAADPVLGIKPPPLRGNKGHLQRAGFGHCKFVHCFPPRDIAHKNIIPAAKSEQLSAAWI